MKKRIARALMVVLIALVLAIGLIALRIYSYRTTVSDLPADAAIVLGAAVWGNDLSPVFKERINHAVELRRNGKVRKVIFTGGQGNRNEPTEAAAARQYAIEQGISAGDILVEEKSHTTYENLLFARDVAVARGLRRVLIVSDPLHMRRAVSMAIDLGLDAYPSPTPTTRYQSATSQIGLLAHETYYYIGYLFRRPFMKQPAVQSRSDHALRIGAVLPGNWDLNESNDEIVIFRQGPVTTYGCVGLDLALFRNPELFKDFVKSTGGDQDYKIRLRFGPKVEPQEYARLKESNEKIKVTKGTTVPNREFYEHHAMQSYDPSYRELPEYYNDQDSIYLEINTVPWACVYPHEVAEECEDVLRRLDTLFQRYSEPSKQRVGSLDFTPLPRRQFP
ncbi:MAG: YdcF family protein [bacterium]